MNTPKKRTQIGRNIAVIIVCVIFFVPSLYAFGSLVVDVVRTMISLYWP